MVRQLRSVVAAVVLAIPSVLYGQADTIRRPLFTWDDAALAGGFVLGTIALRPVDKRVAEQLQNPNNQENRFFRDVSTAFRTTAEPGSLIIGVSMYTYGRLAHKDRIADLGLHGTEAIVVGAAVANVLKVAFGRARPYVHPPTDSTGFDPNSWEFGRGWGNKDYRSFPSGHTVAGFAAAAAVANETSRWWPETRWIIGPLMYGGATMIGLSRMYDNRHWATDVMMGALIGTFAGNKVVRYHHRTNPGNFFDKWLLSASVLPDGRGGMRLAWTVIPGVGM